MKKITLIALTVLMAMSGFAAIPYVLNPGGNATNLTMYGPTVVSNTLTISSNLTVNGNTTVRSNLIVDGTMSVPILNAGTLNVTNYLTPDVLTSTNGATDGMALTYDHGTNKFATIAAGTSTFNTGQFSSANGVTNIKSGATLTNLLVHGDNFGTNSLYIGNTGVIISNANGAVSTTSGNITALSVTESNSFATNAMSVGGGLSAIYSNNVVQVIGTNGQVILGITSTNGAVVIRTGPTGANVTTIASSGALTIPSSLTMTGGSLQVGTQNNVNWLSRGVLSAPADGQNRFLNNASSRIGALQHNWLQLTKTTNYTLLTLDSGSYVDNKGAATVATNTLPASIPGTHFYGAVSTNLTMCFLAVGVDKIGYRGTLGAAAGGVFSAQLGAYIHMTCTETNLWLIDNTSIVPVTGVSDWTIY